jgi:hypothetical protein
MSSNAVSTFPQAPSPKTGSSANLLLGTGLVFASLILVPALAARLGIGSSLTGALRIALMRASSKAIGGKADGSEAETTCYGCH